MLLMFITDFLNWDGIMYFFKTFGNSCWAIGIIFCPLELIALGFGIFIRSVTLVQSFQWKDMDIEFSESVEEEVDNDKEKKLVDESNTEIKEEKIEETKVADPEE